MDVNEALANLETAKQEEAARRQSGDEIDDEVDDEGIEFIDPTLGHIAHFMDLLDALSSPSPEPRPANRPSR